MEWKQQFEIFNKIISQRLSEQGLKSTIKNASEYLGIPTHKYQAWKDGQRPVTEDLRMLAQEFEFNSNWLLLGVGEPIQPRLDCPFDPKYVEICDTLHELVRTLPDRLPKIAEVAGITTTDLYDCIQTQAFPPSEAIAKWVLHYRINANFLLAQIGKPFLTEKEYRESGPLDSVRNNRGDFLELNDLEEDDDDVSTLSNGKLKALRLVNEELLQENRELSKESRELHRHLDENKDKLLACKDEISTLKDKIIALTESRVNTIDPGPFAFDPPTESVSVGKPACGVSGADVLGQCNK